MSMSGCTFNDASLSGTALAMTGLCHPTALSPLQIAAFVTSDLANGGNSPSVRSITTGVLGAGLGLSALYTCFLHLSEHRRMPFVARHVQLDGVDFGHDFGNYTTLLTEPSYRWMDYPAGYFPLNIDPHVDDGSSCNLLSPFAPRLCYPVETDEPTQHELAAQDVDIKNLQSDFPTHFSFSVILGFFVGLLLRVVLFTGIALASGFAAGILILSYRAHLDWTDVFGQLKLLLAKDPSIVFPYVKAIRSLVKDIDLDDFHPVQTPALLIGVEIVEDVPPVLHAESGGLDTASFVSDNEVDDSNIDTTVTVNEGENEPTLSTSAAEPPSSPIAKILLAKKALDDMVEAYIRKVEEGPPSAPTRKEDEVDEYIHSVEMGVPLRKVPLSASASAPLPASGPSSGSDSAAVSTQDTRTGGRRRRKRCRKNKNGNSTSGQPDPHANADPYDTDNDVVPVVEEREAVLQPPEHQVGSMTDTSEEPMPPRRKRTHRGRNRGRGPRIQQKALADDEEVAPNWATA